LFNKILDRFLQRELKRGMGHVFFVSPKEKLREANDISSFVLAFLRFLQGEAKRGI
jgi:hypothetical protein